MDLKKTANTKFNPPDCKYLRVQMCEDTGKIYFYVQRKGNKKSIPLVRSTAKQELDRNEWLEAVIEARADLSVNLNAVKPKDHRIRELVQAWRERPEFGLYSRQSQIKYKYLINKIDQLFGGRRYRLLTPRQVRETLAGLAVSTARDVLALLRQICRWAVNCGLVKAYDPTLFVRIDPCQKGGFPAWPVREIERFRAFYAVGSRERLAFELIYFTGARVGDAIRLGPGHVVDGQLRWRTSKTGKVVQIPIVAELLEVLAKSETGRETFLLQANGVAFKTSQQLTMLFRKWCERAGIENNAEMRQLSAHGLRKNAAIRLRQAGVPEDAIMAVLGWSSWRMARVYQTQLNGVELASKFGGHLSDNRDT